VSELSLCGDFILPPRKLFAFPPRCLLLLTVQGLKYRVCKEVWEDATDNCSEPACTSNPRVSFLNSLFLEAPRQVSGRGLAPVVTSGGERMSRCKCQWLALRPRDHHPLPVITDGISSQRLQVPPILRQAFYEKVGLES
jgi:hypothetical protein